MARAGAMAPGKRNMLTRRCRTSRGRFSINFPEGYGFTWDPLSHAQQCMCPVCSAEAQVEADHPLLARANHGTRPTGRSCTVCLQRADYLLANGMCLQGILGQRRAGMPGCYGVQKLTDDLRESAAMQNSLPIVEASHALCTCMPMGGFDQVSHDPLVVRTHDLQYFFGRAAVAIHGSDELKTGTTELHQNVVKLAFENITVRPDITDGAGSQKTQCIHHMYKIIENHASWSIETGSTVLQHKDEPTLRLVRQLPVHGCIATIKSNHQQGPRRFGELYQSTGSLQRVRDRLVDIHRNRLPQ